MSEPTPTPTPETDIQVVKVMTQYTNYGDCVKADFARTLERQRDALAADADALARALESACWKLEVIFDGELPERETLAAHRPAAMQPKPTPPSSSCRSGS